MAEVRFFLRDQPPGGRLFCCCVGGETVAKVGRPKIYKTGKQLQRAVDGYFGQISYEREVIVRRERVVENEATGKPEIVTEPEVLVGSDGKPVKETVWLEPPSEEALMLHIGIRSRDTWAKYAKDDELGPVVEMAKARIKAWLVGELNTRNSTQGIAFNLKVNYGWKEQVDLTGDGLVQVNLGGRAAEAAE